MMKYIKITILLSIIFISCNRNIKKEENEIIFEKAENVNEIQSNNDYKNLLSVADNLEFTFLELTQSVDPELLRNVMPIAL